MQQYQNTQRGSVPGVTSGNTPTTTELGTQGINSAQKPQDNVASCLISTSSAHGESGQGTSVPPADPPANTITNAIVDDPLASMRDDRNLGSRRWKLTRRKTAIEAPQAVRVHKVPTVDMRLTHPAPPQEAEKSLNRRKNREIQGDSS